MAEILEVFDWPTGRQGRGTKYPYDEWLDGKIRKLVKQKDFPTASVATMKNNLGGAAKKKNLKLQFAKLDEDTVVVQALEKS